MSANQYPIPRRYLEASRLNLESALDPRCSQWASNWKGASGAILIGPTGCGKSTAAALAANRVKQTDTWAKWVRADELSRILSERGGIEHVQVIKQARVLVLDELGYERFPELLLEVLGARHDACRPTVVTSGLTLDAIAARYSDATVRRILEIGTGSVVDCWAQAKPRAVAK